MPGCVLHVAGEKFEPERALHQRSVKPYSVLRKGDKRFGENSKNTELNRHSGFKCDVSKIQGDLVGQANDAVSFLTEHYADLLALHGDPTIESMCLDFGYDCRLDPTRSVVQCDTLPWKLLKLCGALGIDIELSLYPPLDVER